LRHVKRVGLVASALAISVPGAEGMARAQQSAARGGAEVSAGGFLWRALGDRSPGWHDGLELAWGPSLADVEGAWRFTGLVQMDLRAFATSSWALAVSTHTFEVSGRVGPLEPFARVGGSLLTVDDFDGSVSAELASPRVGAGIAVRVSRAVEIGVEAYSEYFWRWFGPSALVHGLLLDVRFERRMRRQ
jgi:hypothetical protein